jgi:transposase
MPDTELLLKSEPLRRLEVFTGSGRRRTWTPEQKAEIVAECNRTGASVSAVARRHGLTPQQLFGWRRDVRRQAEEPAMVRAFAPVVVVPDATMPTSRPELCLIEVVIGAVMVRIPRGVDSATLEAVVRAVKAAT